MNIKTRYVEITRSAKEEVARAAKQAKGSPGADEEERLFAQFRRRAREEFRTLKPTSAKSGNTGRC